MFLERIKIYNDLVLFLAKNCTKFECLNKYNYSHIELKILSHYSNDFFIKIKICNENDLETDFFKNENQTENENLFCICDCQFGNIKRLAFVQKLSFYDKMIVENDVILLLATSLFFTENLEMLLNIELDKFKSHFRLHY